ncbi:MAG: DUF2141 domain-containing protein [Gammaproteobacteria bacterium]|nr:DUF2141 domain-containing protein [Gammaproteobacteria bacterium]
MPSIKPLLILLALSAPISAMAEDTTLTVNVVDADPPSGTVEVSIFDSEESFLNTARAQYPCVPDADGACTSQFVRMTPGDYAVVVVHDANGNNKLDNGILGFGAESFAYSNGAKNPLFGRASFDDVKIRVEGETVIEISLD